MRRPSKILALLICAIGISPRLHAEEPISAPKEIDIAAIPEREWELPKDSAYYEITSDVWFARLEEFSKTKPQYPPGTGIGDGGGGEFATVVFIPKSAGEGPHRKFEVHLPYSWTGDTFEMRRFFLSERVIDGDTTRGRIIGSYTDISMLTQIRAEVLLQSQALKKSPKVKAANGKWQVAKTLCKDVSIDGPLPEEIKALLGKPSSPGKPDDPKPWLSIWFYPATLAPSQRNRQDLRFHRIEIHKDGRLKIHEVMEKPEENISRDLGWFKSPDQWNKLRITVLRHIEKRRSQSEPR